MSKIVFFDIDGTLLNHEKKLPARTKEAVRLLQKKGIYTAIATGRAPFMFEDLREELNIQSFISFNGQYVVFEGEAVHLNPLHIDSLTKLVAQAEEKEHPLVFMNESIMRANHSKHEHIETSFRSLNFPHPLPQPDFYKQNDLYQTLLFCGEEEEMEYREQFPEFTFIRWHPYSLDIVPAGGSKAVGIEKMLERLPFELEDVYAFGDGLNDIEMLRVAGVGVAMGNAHPTVKEQANMVTTDVADDGIFLGLEKLGLI
ncbi:Cof-type HAD-IIB family hydrolase [Bacillus sp. REN10]|uniref:Cof-type HAD-IIB family hydrolase n=1 Tax=Bacillus sp. REN10 TaxID=2782541 RepID=UPI00193C4C4E|nr:Cof-type HAD-IIB family hydrolase [Bacillus sp. REN10]